MYSTLLELNNVSNSLKSVCASIELPPQEFDSVDTFGWWAAKPIKSISG